MKNQLSERERAEIITGRRRWVRRNDQTIRVQYSDPGNYVFDYRFPTLAQAMGGGVATAEAKGNQQ